MKAQGYAWRGGVGRSVLLFIVVASFVPGVAARGGNLQDLFQCRLHRDLAVAAAWNTPDPLPASLWGSPGRI